MNTGTTRSAQSLIQDFRRNAAFYKNGGITVTGGESKAGFTVTAVFGDKEE